jgi:hypothetical protein
MLENNTIAASEMLVANTYYNSSAPTAKVKSIFHMSQIISHFGFSKYTAFMYFFYI